MRPQPWLVVVLVGAIVGVLFAGISTYDFVQHLDRQIHTIHCSFIPGGGAALGSSGCQTAMMSPYSSVLRASVWGGVPIALAAMSVFAFIAFFAIDLALSRRQDDPRATGFLAAATGLPVLTSIVMAYISITKLHSTCKLCVAIYVASAACLIGALVVWRRAVAMRAAPVDTGQPGLVRSAAPTVSHGYLAGAFGIGVLFVAVPIVLYLASAPDHSTYIGSCDGLAHPEDPYGVMVPMGRSRSDAAPAVEILDPMCPACRAFEERLAASGLEDRLDRRAVLFPLDSTCNWMVDEPIHPGACAISEAVLCAGDRADEVLSWAFANQDRIVAAAKVDPEAAAKIAKQRFPELAECIGSPAAKSRLNKSLRWAVSNGVKVLTPQLYIDGVKLCDEDVDLGLEYTLTAMLDKYAAGQLVAESVSEPAPTKLEPTPEEQRALSAGAGKPIEGEGTGSATGGAPSAAPPAAPTAPSGQPASGATGAASGETKPSGQAPTPPAATPPATGTEPAPPGSGTPTTKPATPPATKPATPPATKPATPPAAPDEPVTKPSDTPTEPSAPTEGGTP